MGKRSPGSYLSFFFIALAVVAIVTLPALYYISKLDEAVVRMIEDALQKKVVLGDMRISFDKGLGFRLDHISIIDPHGEAEELIFSAEQFFVGLDIRSLLRGRIRILRVYGFRPRIFITRDASGELNLSRLYSPGYVQENLPGSMETHPLARVLGPVLSKNWIYLEAGEIHFRDVSLRDPNVLSVQNLNLHINSRILRDELHVEISGEIVKPKGGGSFSLAGDLRHWKEARSLAELRVDMNLGFQNVSLEGLSGHLPPRVRARRLSGNVNGRLTYEGCPLLPGRATVALDLESPVWHNPHVHPKPFSPTSVSVRASGEVRSDQFWLDQAEINLGGLRVQARGGLLAREGPFSHLELHLHGKDLALAQAKQYLPLGLLRGRAWPFLVKMTTGGTVDAQADLVGALPDFSRMGTPQGEDAFQLRLEFRDTTIQLPIEEPYLPFRSVRGTLELKEGELRFHDFSAHYGKARLTHASGWIRDIHKSSSQMDVRGTAELDFPEAVAELDHGIIPEAVREVSRQVHDASGRAGLEIRILYDFGKEVEERTRIMGRTLLNRVRARYGTLPLPFADVTGTIEFTESSLSDLDVRGLLGGTPLAVQGQIGFAESQGAPRGEIRWASSRLDPADVVVLLGRDWLTEGELPAQGTVRPDAGLWSWDVTIGPGNLTVSGGRHVFPLTGLRAALSSDGRSTDLREATFQVHGNPLTLRAQMSSLSPMIGRLEASSPSVDVDALFQQKKTSGPLIRLLRPETKPSSSWTDGDLKVSLDFDRFTYRALSFDSLRVRGGVSRGTILVEEFRALRGPGRVALVGEATREEERFPFSLQVSLNEISSEDLFRMLNVSPGFFQGSLTLEGDIRGAYDPHGRLSSSLAGNVSLKSEAGVIHRYDLLSKILTLVNVAQWSKIRLSDFKAQGIPFRSIRGDLHIEKGALSTENLQIDCSIAMANLNGSYDFLQDQMKVLLSLRPLEQLDQVLDLLPVVGRIVQGPDGTIVIFYYRLEGPLKDPQVTLIPFKNLDQRLRDFPVRELNRWLRTVEEAFLGAKSF